MSDPVIKTEDNTPSSMSVPSNDQLTSSSSVSNNAAQLLSNTNQMNQNTTDQTILTSTSSTKSSIDSNVIATTTIAGMETKNTGTISMSNLVIKTENVTASSVVVTSNTPLQSSSSVSNNAAQLLPFTNQMNQSTSDKTVLISTTSANSSSKNSEVKTNVYGLTKPPISIITNSTNNSSSTLTVQADVKRKTMETQPNTPIPIVQTSVIPQTSTATPPATTSSSTSQTNTSSEANATATPVAISAVPVVEQSNGETNAASKDEEKEQKTNTVVVLNKQRLQELVAEIDSNEQLDDDVEDMLLNIGDDFIENLISNSCLLAKHRGSKNVEVKDVQMILEKNYNMYIPGFGSLPLNEEFKNVYKKSPATEAHKQRMALIKKTLKKF